MGWVLGVARWGNISDTSKLSNGYQLTQNEQQDSCFFPTIFGIDWIVGWFQSMTFFILTSTSSIQHCK